MSNIAHDERLINPLAEIAAAYAARGWAILPLQPGTKQPLPGSEGFKDAHSRWQAADWPSVDSSPCNIGFVPASAGMVVIDLDPGHDEDLAAELLPLSMEVETPRGTHCYYKTDKLFGNARLAAHIDVRNSAGYVLLPPSMVDGRAYKWTQADGVVDLPPKTEKRLSEAKPQERKKAPKGLDTPENIARGRRMLKETDVTDTSWNIAVRLRRDLGLSEGTAIELFDAWSQTLEWGWPYDKIERTVVNAGRYGRDEGSGRADSSAYPTPEENLEGKTYKRPVVKLRSRAEAMAVEPPKMLIEGLIPDCKVIMPWGGTGEGKTYFIAELATAIVMRRPAFGRFKVVPKDAPGVVVMFMGEDCTEFDQGRLVAIEQHYGTSLDGLVFTIDMALPLDNLEMLEACREAIRTVQRETGKRIEAIFDDTLGRTIGTLKPNDGETGHLFTVMAEGLVAEFHCPVIVNAHEPKTGGTISGTQRFLDNCPVTPHIEGEKAGGELRSFKVTMEPKYRIGKPPRPFTVVARTVKLPKPVNGCDTDLVFTQSTVEERAEIAKVTAKGDYRNAVLDALRRVPGAEVPIDAMALILCGPNTSSEDATVKNVRKSLRHHVLGRKGNTKADMADLAKRDPMGDIMDPVVFKMPQEGVVRQC